MFVSNTDTTILESNETFSSIFFTAFSNSSYNPNTANVSKVSIRVNEKLFKMNYKVALALIKKF